MSPEQVFIDDSIIEEFVCGYVLPSEGDKWGQISICHGDDFSDFEVFVVYFPSLNGF